MSTNHSTCSVCSRDGCSWWLFGSISAIHAIVWEATWEGLGEEEGTAGYIFNEAMRATLGVIAAEGKKKAQTRGKKGKGKKRSSRNVSDEASSASPTVPAEQLALDPSHLEAAAEEAMDTNQDQANGNDNEFDVYDDAFDEFVMQEEELLLAKFAEYRTIVDKSVGN